jgi:hypothetical protein
MVNARMAIDREGASGSGVAGEHLSSEPVQAAAVIVELWRQHEVGTKQSIECSKGI